MTSLISKTRHALGTEYVQNIFSRSLKKTSHQRKLKQAKAWTLYLIFPVIVILVIVISAKFILYLCTLLERKM